MTTMKDILKIILYLKYNSSDFKFLNYILLIHQGKVIYLKRNNPSENSQNYRYFDRCRRTKNLKNRMRIQIIRILICNL